MFIKELQRKKTRRARIEQLESTVDELQDKLFELEQFLGVEQGYVKYKND